MNCCKISHRVEQVYLIGNGLLEGGSIGKLRFCVNDNDSLGMMILRLGWGSEIASITRILINPETTICSDAP